MFIFVPEFLYQRTPPNLAKSAWHGGGAGTETTTAFNPFSFAKFVNIINLPLRFYIFRGDYNMMTDVLSSAAF